MSQFDFNQLSKKIKNLSGSPNTNCLKTERQRKKQKALIQEILPAIHETKEKEFQHGPFWSSNCLSELFQRERTL